MGVIAQDIALAELVLARAEESGIGIEFDPATGHCLTSQAAQPSAAGVIMAGAT